MRSARSCFCSLTIASLLELAQIAQAHVEDGFGLAVVELEGRHQLGLGLVLLADDADHLIEIEIRDAVGFEDFEAILDLAETVTWSA